MVGRYYFIFILESWNKNFHVKWAINNQYYFSLGGYDWNYDKTRFYVLWKEHKPFLLAPETKENFITIHHTVKRFIDHLDKALTSIDTFHEKSLNTMITTKRKPKMNLRDRKFIFHQVEQIYLKSQLNCLNIIRTN